MSVDQQISKAWLEAATDLGILVVAPFRLDVGEGEIVWFEAHIANFGSPNGTVVGNIEAPVPGVRQIDGYFASDLGPAYRRYYRQYFMDTLNDWGWFGKDGQQPSWYTGQPWS